MPITNISQSVNLNNKSNYYLNLPSNAGLSSGYWFYYSASSANSTIPGKIVPYRWGTQLTTVEGETLTMEGTIPLATESLNRQRIFHGSTITRIGPGINDITLAQEEDAFYFYHIGALSAGDTPGYWDRAFKLSVGGGEWDYYQYHQHSPNVYASYDSARIAQAGYTYINESDKRFAYLQPIQVSNMGTNYLQVLARIHQPSVGGAHNSHNDIELGSSTTKNYQIAGIIPGTSDKFHAFYIAASSSKWEVFSRTYVLANGSFTSEINHGAYDLAAPTFSVASARYEKPPLRASVGALLGSNVYVPVIYTSGSKFNLNIWSFPSATSVSTGDIVVTTLLTGSNFQPDCHLTTANNELNAVVSDVNAGCVGYYKLSSSAWVKQGDIVTNGTQEVLRIHGFNYNPQDNLFYTLISGNITGSGTYSGSGIYSFSDGAVFTGYEHISYITSSYGFQLKNALSPGYLKYTKLDGSLVFQTGSEPQSVDEAYQVLKYDIASPKFFDQHETHIGGKEYFYAGTKLQDGRTILVGNIESNEDNKGGADLLLAVYPEDGGDVEYYAAGTSDIDYFTGIVEDTQRRCLWMTGYTRGYLASKKDIKIHAFGRGLIDGDNFLEWRDVSTDISGSQYIVGNHITGDRVVAAKYDANLDLVWQRDISNNSFATNSMYGITVDSNNNSYIAGKSGGKALVIKFDSTGSLLFSNLYSSSNSENYATSIATVAKSSQEYIVVPIVSGSSTTITILDTTGSIVEQNFISNFIVNKVRKSDSEQGYFLLAGKTSGSISQAKFAKAEVLATGDMLKWMYTFSSGSIPTGSTYTVTNQGLNNYVFNGGGFVDQTDPTLTVVRGATYVFNVNATGHPFWIKTAQVTGTGSAYNVGVTNNGTSSGSIIWEVSDTAPSTLYYICQIHSGMSGTINVVSSTTKAFEAFDIKNTEAGVGNTLGSGLGPKYHIVGNNGADGFITKIVVDDDGIGTFQASRLWARTIASSSIASLTNTLYTTSPTSSLSTYVIGYTSASAEGEGLDDAIIAKFDYNGDRLWSNTLGHMGNDRLLSTVNDVTQDNLLSVGWSESHTNGRRTFLFRSSNTGLGTGNYHLEGYAGLEMQYKSSSISVLFSSGSLSTISALSDVVGSVTRASQSYTSQNLQYSEEIYDGGVSYDMFIAKLDLDTLQTHKNTEEHKAHNSVCNAGPEYVDDNFTFYQVGTSGDGTADDGNYFGYDLLLMTGSNKVFVAGQSSGDIAFYNLGGSGIYDYCLAVFDPETESFEFYQSGSSQDEEIYACTELNDGSGSIAFVGRSIGTFATSSFGGYDIFLGIYNPINDNRRYFSYGSILNDRGVNVHDLGNNELAIVYETADSVGTSTSAGGFDIGVIKFNYNTNTWATASFQAGSDEDEFLSQDGKPSCLLPDGRIVITGKTLGPFSDGGQSYGNTDMFLGILDLSDGTYKKYQIGTAGNENGTTVFYLGGGQIGVAGYTDASFEEPVNGIFVKFDAILGVKSRIE